ncbi:MAG: hypothetical protein IT430_02210 [Phycisphaerales bacterium]|nr:hypothetical protein [Phycisphaerales bacterium]
MRKLALLASAACCVAALANSALAQTYNENFDDPFGDWTTRWFYQNTNAGNYYVASGNCDESYRGNNPCGLWITDTQTCGGGNGGPTSTITFDPSFGASISSFAFDLSAYVDQRLTIYDMSGNIVLDVPSVTRTSNVCAGFRYTATSNNGISRIVMDSTSNGGSQIEGNTAWDNIEVIAGPPSLSLSVTGACPGTVTVAWNNATPNTQLAIVFGQNQGSTIIPGGPCAGTELGVQNGVQLIRTVSSGANGNGSVNGAAGTAACGRYLQLVEAGSCDTSNVDQIP